MSKKNDKSKSKPAAKAVAKTTTSVRKTSIPKVTRPAQQKVAKPAVTYELIALRAYFISQSPQCGSELDNWFRAERELRGL